MSAAEMYTRAYRTAVVGFAIVLVSLLVLLVTGAGARRGVIDVDYGTPLTPPTGTLPRAAP